MEQGNTTIYDKRHATSQGTTWKYDSGNIRLEIEKEEAMNTKYNSWLTRHY